MFSRPNEPSYSASFSITGTAGTAGTADNPSHFGPVRRVFALGFLTAFNLLASSHVAAQTTANPLSNPFNDPHFQFTAAVADCPQPLGPLITAEEQASQAHRRAEKGTSCWLAGTCDKPNAYAYDADIATALKAALGSKQLYTHSPLVHSSLWATVQGRIVTIEGCVAGDAYTSFDHEMIRTQIENVAKAVPQVLQAVVLVRTSGQTKAGAAVPYKTRP